jgi:uncharacterized protein (TIGR02246 family)
LPWSPESLATVNDSRFVSHVSMFDEKRESMPNNLLLADDEAAVLEVPVRLTAAWTEHDGDAFAAVCTEDANMILPGDVYLTSREQILSFMKAAFAGPYKGTQVYGTPLGVKSVAEGIVLLTTEGGVMGPGETVVSSAQAIRATWMLVKRDSEWLIASYQNTPVGAA